MRPSPKPVSADRRGVAMVEFAVALPVVLIMMVAMADVVQFGRGYLRAQSAALQIGQIISQCEQYSASDDTILKELTGRILGRYAEGGARYALRITAFGQDSKGRDFDWSVSQNGGAGRTGEPSLAFTSKSKEMPKGDQGDFKMDKNRMLFRTEVFVSLNQTPLSGAISVLREKGVPVGFVTARGESVFSTRVPKTDGLSAKGSEGCLT